MKLTDEVQKLLGERWELYGSPSVALPSCFTQAVVQYQEEKTK